MAKNRRAAGWRGISVDLIVDPEGPTSNSESKAIPQGQRDKETTDEAPDNNDKLEGAVVRLIWRKSRLDSTRLAEIWFASSTHLLFLLITSSSIGMNVI